MKPIIGSSIWYGSKHKVQLIEKLHSFGFDYIEISLDYPWPHYKNEELERVVKKAKSLGLEIAFHGPWRDIRLASPIPILASTARSIIRSIINKVLKYEPEYFNVHLISDEITFDDDVKNDVLKEAKASIEFLSKTSEETELTITIENNPMGYFSLPSYFSEVDLLNLGLCLDAGHATVAYYNLGETTTSPMDILKEWVNIISEGKIVASHIHDVVVKNGIYVNHYYFGHGLLDLKELGRFLYRKIRVKYVLLEMFRKNEDANVLTEREVLEVLKDKIC